MTISVALCTYNGALYLQEQLDSIAQQTRLPDELVACDDGSSDATPAILEAFAAGSPFPVRIHRNPVNLGSTKNFEQAVRLCQGEIIALCDQDDLWLPEKLAKIEAKFADKNVGLVFTDAEVVDGDLKPLGIRLWDAYFPVKAQRRMKAGKAFSVQLDCNVVTGATMAFRSDLRNIVLPIPSNISLIHDGWIALVIAAVYKLAFLPEPLILYRQHPHQQIGVRERQEQKEARVLPRQHYVRHLLQLEELKSRLEAILDYQSGYNLRPAIQHVQAHVQHLRVRLELPPAGLMRYGSVLTQLLTGQYHQYSNGFRSAARDFLYPLDAAGASAAFDRPNTERPNTERNAK